MVSISYDDDSVFAVAIMCLENNRQFVFGGAEPVIAEEPLYHVWWIQVEEQSDHLDP